jgi:hypothetical protein
MVHSHRSLFVALPLALLLIAPRAQAWDLFGASSGAPDARAQMGASPVIAEYQRKLGEYQEARASFDAQAVPYWKAIADKRRIRNAKRRDRQPIDLDDYVLDQAPLYDGPRRPVDPQPPEDTTPRVRKEIPVVADLIRASAEYFQFTPQRPTSELEFKRAYARAAAASGLTREQAVRVYSFETGGNGNYDMQSGLSSKPGSRAISTAIGYNQLLTTNSVELIAEQGQQILRVLTEKAAMSPPPQRKMLDHKIAAFKRMVAFARSVPDDWSAHEKLANTPQGWALHAMVLDIDVGPQLQVHKLLTSVIFARERGFGRPLSAAELEMMNLTGDGTGFDMVTMPQALREQVPTSNFFQRGGYERNPVAIRHNTVAKLLAITNNRMDSNSGLPGARDLAGVFQQGT